MADPINPTGAGSSDSDPNRSAPVEFPRHHIGDDLINTMTANLIANNANPEAIEAMREARDIAMAVSVTADPNPTPAPFVPVWKFPETKALCEALVTNLTENGADPDAIEAKRHARDVARADEQSPPGGTETTKGE